MKAPLRRLIAPAAGTGLRPACRARRVLRAIHVALLALLAAPGTARGEGVVLTGGGRLEGKVVKRTPEAVFLDVGYTILMVPLREVKEVEETAPSPKPEAAPPVPAAVRAPSAPAAQPLEPLKRVEQAGSSRERREGIYFLAECSPGSIKDKAREVGEGVVQVVCPGKLGSGFIINDQDPYVVTNYHVVEGDQDIAVVVYVREEHDFRKLRLERVKIVALNPFLDLALLRIEEQEAPAGVLPKGFRFHKVYLTDSEAVRVGDPVFAVGSPLGLERTVTEGIVSNARRALGGLVYLQTSAPINPGNSGGPLFNDRGEVIGITSLKVAFGESLGFAIPVNYLKDFVRNREAFAFDKDNPNSGIRYLAPPRKPGDRKLPF